MRSCCAARRCSSTRGRGGRASASAPRGRPGPPRRRGRRWPGRRRAGPRSVARSRPSPVRDVRGRSGRGRAARSKASACGRLGRRRRRVLGGALRRRPRPGSAWPAPRDRPARVVEQGRGEPVVALARGPRGQTGHHRLADAVVVGLDLVAARARVRVRTRWAARSAARALSPSCSRSAARYATSASRGSARDGDDLQQPPRCAPAAARRASPGRLVEGHDGRGGRDAPALGLREAHQLLDEERVAARLARRSLPPAHAAPRGSPAEQRQGQLAAPRRPRARPTAMSRTSSADPAASRFGRMAWSSGLVSRLLAAVAADAGAAPAGRAAAAAPSSRAALSASPHCRSSMKSTSGRRSARRTSSSRRAANARRRSSSESGISSTARRAARHRARPGAAPGTRGPGPGCRGAGAPRPRAAAGAAGTGSGRRPGCRAPCTAPTRARSSARRGPPPRRPRAAARRGSAAPARSCPSPSGRGRPRSTVAAAASTPRRRRAAPRGAARGRRSGGRGRRRGGGGRRGRRRRAPRSRGSTSAPEGRWPGSRRSRLRAERVEVRRARLRRSSRGGRGSDSLLAPDDLEHGPREGQAAGQRLVEHRRRRCTSRWPGSGAAPRPARATCRRACRPPRPVCVCAGAISATRPKSRSTTRPSRVTSTLDGLMSRWSLPASCRAQTPSTSWGSACAEAVQVERARAERLPRRAARPAVLEEGRSAARQGPRGRGEVVAGPDSAARSRRGTYQRKSTPSTSSMVKNHCCLARRQLVEGHEVGVGDVGQRAELLLEAVRGPRGATLRSVFEGDGDVPRPGPGPRYTTP